MDWWIDRLIDVDTHLYPLICTDFPIQLNFSEEHYFENILENLKSEAHKSLKKLREPVDPNL